MAAVIAYGLNKKGNGEQDIYGIGGDTFDASLLTMNFQPDETT